MMVMNVFSAESGKGWHTLLLGNPAQCLVSVMD